MPLDRQLIPLKLQYFFLSGATGCLIPFLPLYFKSIGFSATQSALVVGIMPFAAAFCNPLVGGLSDKWSCHKAAIIFCCLLSAVGHTGVKFIPLAFQNVNQTHHNLSSPVSSEHCEPQVGGVFTKLFLSVFVLEIISYGMSEPASGITDALTYEQLGEERRGDYGQQHILAAAGYPIFSAICGALIDVTNRESDKSFYIYLPLFSMYVFFMFCVSFNTCAISARARTQQESSFRAGLSTIIKNFDLITLFLITIIFGILCGVSTAFLTWYLQEIGASETLIGTSSIAFVITELPTLYFAGSIMEKFGMVNTMHLTFFIYGVRYLSYGLMKNPWFIYVIEPLHGATSALMFTVTTAYAMSKTPEGVGATATGLVYGSQLLGRGVGSVVGGLVYDNYGPQKLFFGCSVLSGAGILLLLIFRIIAYSYSKFISNEERRSLLLNDERESFIDSAQA